MNPTLEIIGLSHSYGTLKVLSEINIKIYPGEIVCVLGPNGAGKTTLLRCILNAVQFREGEILLSGKSNTACTGTELARILSYVPQEVAIPFPYSSFEVVLMGRYPSTAPFQMASVMDMQSVEKEMKATGIFHLADRPFNKLSGGEKQEVLLARASVQETPIMLLDEPNSNLDIRHITMMLNHLKKRRTSLGQSILLVTHDLNLAMTGADRVILVKKGRIVANGSAEEVLTREQVNDVYETDVRVIKSEDGKGRVFTYNLDE